MATKKQKRQAALEKRAKFEAQVKAEGLLALKKAKEHEAKVKGIYLAEIEQINQRHNKILQDAGLVPLVDRTKEEPHVIGTAQVQIADGVASVKMDVTDEKARKAMQPDLSRFSISFSHKED